MASTKPTVKRSKQATPPPRGVRELGKYERGAEKSAKLFREASLLGARVIDTAVDYINDPRIDPDAARAILDQNASALLGIGQERTIP